MADRGAKPRTAVVLAAVLALGGCTTFPGPATEAPLPANPTGQSSPTSQSSPTATGRPAGDAERAEPVALSIAAMDLDEELIPLGLADDGTLQVPEDADRVGWFTGGGRPGGPGPTVLAGHVDSDTGPAVFFRLTELRPGDRIEVRLSGATTVGYEVTEVRDVPKDTFPTELVFGATPDDELRLITCTGFWDPQQRSHRDNRVVFATVAG